MSASSNPLPMSHFEPVKIRNFERDSQKSLLVKWGRVLHM